MKVIEKVFTIRPLFEKPGLDTFVLEYNGQTHIGTRKYVEYRLKKYQEHEKSVTYCERYPSNVQFKVRMVQG